MWIRSLDWEVPLEEGMATHSSILAWRIPWTDEPGRLQSIELQRAGHDFGGFPDGLDGKESACNVGDPGSVPGLGRYLEKGIATHTSTLAWRIPWTEEPNGLQSWGCKELDMTERLSHIHPINVFTHI